MTPGPANLALLLLAGGATGALGTLLGIGGGVFLIPALVLWFHAPMGSAVAAGLISVIATSNAAASANVARGTVNLRLGMVLELATVLGALSGGAAAAWLPARLLIGAFGILLGAVSTALWRDGAALEADAEEGTGALGGRYVDPATGRAVVYSVRRLPVALGASFAAGNLSGLLGVGGGVIKVPALHLLCGMPMKAAAATSNFMIGVTAAASAFLYVGRGAMDPGLTAPVALGVLGGAWLGHRIDRKLEDRGVRRLFSAVTAFLCVQMLWRAYGGG